MVFMDTDTQFNSLAQLEHILQTYWQLPYHRDASLEAKLSDVQNFQRLRVYDSHKDIFELPQNQKMADYFVNQLYGGEQFTLMAKQLDIILPKAKKFEKLVPSGALETGILAIAAAIEAIELDLQLAQWLSQNDLPVTYDNMLNAYQRVGAKTQRFEQITHMKQVCYRTDKYINSFILQKAFALAKGTAYANGLQPFYDFIDAGFVAMKPLGKVAHFIEPFAERERQIVEHVHGNTNDGRIDPHSAPFVYPNY